MKRKTDTRGSLDGNAMPESKKRALSSEEAAARFRDGLFDVAEQQKYTGEYAGSSPYVNIEMQVNANQLTFSDHSGTSTVSFIP